jgi:hypothetical protein
MVVSPSILRGRDFDSMYQKWIVVRVDTVEIRIWKFTEYTCYLENWYDTNFDAPDAHFDKPCLLSDAQVDIFENSKCYDCKGPKRCREVESNQLKDICSILAVIRC